MRDQTIAGSLIDKHGHMTIKRGPVWMILGGSPGKDMPGKSIAFIYIVKCRCAGLIIGPLKTAVDVQEGMQEYAIEGREG